MIEGIFVEGLAYAVMVLGVFITFRILNFPDLTVDGSFPLGAAIAAIMITNGQSLILAIVVSFLGGLLAGVVTAVIHNKLGVPNLLAGILTMTMLWSVNIRVLGNKANLPLLRQETVVSRAVDLLEGVVPQEWAVLLFFFVFAMGVKLLLDLFFRTDLGLTLGAMGDNEQMVISTGVNPEVLKMIGVGLSNGLVALSGALVAQYQGFADVNLGQGIIIAGLASVMIGEFILRSNRIGLLTLRVILGSILYRGLMYLGRFYGYHINLTPTDLKLITGLLIILSLIITQIRRRKPSRQQPRPHPERAAAEPSEPPPAPAGATPPTSEPAASEPVGSGGVGSAGSGKEPRR